MKKKSIFIVLLILLIAFIDFNDYFGLIGAIDRSMVEDGIVEEKIDKTYFDDGVTEQVFKSHSILNRKSNEYQVTGRKTFEDRKYTVFINFRDDFEVKNLKEGKQYFVEKINSNDAIVKITDLAKDDFDLKDNFLEPCLVSNFSKDKTNYQIIVSPNNLEKYPNKNKTYEDFFADGLYLEDTLKIVKDAIK